jgi:hypothetical protein
VDIFIHPYKYMAKFREIIELVALGYVQKRLDISSA